MSKVIIEKPTLSGSATPPPSKSAAHRALFCAALANGKSTITPFAMSNDMTATIGAIRGLGACVENPDTDIVTVDGSRTFQNVAHSIDCLESGSTLRFLIPVAALSGREITFTGRGRLPSRPIGPYLECLPSAGVSCESAGGLPLTVNGKLESGVFSLPGDISSQFITGLLLALPVLGGKSEIRLTTALQSAGYIHMTVDVMRRFGVEVGYTETGFGIFSVNGGQHYAPTDFDVEGDWSQAAFWLAAGALGGEISCGGLRTDSAQGDRTVTGLLERFGASVHAGGNGVRVSAGQLHGTRIDAAQVPDLVPVLAVVAALSEGQTVIRNAARLRIKESDRLHAITLGLRALGADVSELPDGLIINGREQLDGGSADGFGDHRIVMALSIAALRCRGKVTIMGCESIKKSYPDFFQHYNKLGGNAHVIDLG